MALMEKRAMAADDARRHRPSDEEIREARPFFAVLFIVIVGIYVLALTTDPGLLVPNRLIPFTILLATHAALHWTCLYLGPRSRWIYPYFAVQSGIATLIAIISQGHGIVLGLYLALAGEAVGVKEDFRQSAGIVAGILAVALVTFGLTLGWSSLPTWVALILPMALFVVVYVMMFGRQTRQRQEAQRLLRELETAHRQLAEYAARVEDLTLAAERQRMARELHDTLAQGLAGLILQLEAADAHLGQGRSDKAQDIVQQAMGRARSTLAAARQAIADLRTGPLGPAEWAQAVREEADRFSRASGIVCHLQVEPPASLPGPAADNALRAVSEGLTNVARHAKATQVWVEVGAEGGALKVSVRDDGQGLKPGTEQDRPGHFGLTGLRERARLAGGTLNVRSEPGRGTELTMILPLAVQGVDG
jgi:NarL family two-component system sensor histidine kinase YdfH